MGEKFGHYELVKKLATGGMAEVLLAKQRGVGGFERLVCLKRILPHLAEQNDFLSMFLDEARIAANLVHPNIAQIYDIGEVENQYYIAMEYVRGEDVRRIYNQEVARGRTIAPARAALIIMGAAAGLEYAHRQTNLSGAPLGIVHRDISPQNILVTYDGFAKVIDFGVAKAQGKLGQTRAGVLKGKYSYMSPEQALGDPVDGRSDIFALGITLYEITTGTRLFKRENELETLHAVIACSVPSPSSIIPEFDRDLETILLRALAYDPDERYQTAGELEQDLERYLFSQGHPVSATSLGAYMHDLFVEKLAEEAVGDANDEAQSSSDASNPRDMPSAPIGQILDEERTSIDSEKAGAAPLQPPTWDSQTQSEEKTRASGPDKRATSPADDSRDLKSFATDEASPTRRTFAPVQVTRKTYRLNKVFTQALIAASVAFTCYNVGRLFFAHRKEASEAKFTEKPPQTQDEATAIVVTPSANPSERLRMAMQENQSLLSITSNLPMTLQAGDNFLGEMPAEDLKLAPGPISLELTNRREGFRLRRSFLLRAGARQTWDVSEETGLLDVCAKGTAWVRRGLLPAQEAPMKETLRVGEYELVIECDDGRRKSEIVHVEPRKTTFFTIDCAS